MLKGKNVSAMKTKITDEQYFAYFKVISSPDDSYYAADSDVWCLSKKKINCVFYSKS